MNQRTRDLLSAGRVANLPTVWTNLLTGALIASFLLIDTYEAEYLGRFLTCLLAGSFLYLGGCFYNDFHDRKWDAEFKPDRAIPAGRVSASLLLGLTLGCLGIGVCVTCFLGVTAFLASFWILFFIWVYTKIHKKTALGVIPMGLCRVGLYLLGISVVRDIPLTSPYILNYLASLFKTGVLSEYLKPGAGLFFYIVGITLLARFEARPSLPKGLRFLALSLFFIPLFTHPILRDSFGFILLAIGAYLFMFKNAVTPLGEKNIGGFVGRALAGICLVDFLLVFTYPTTIGNRLILGTGVLLCFILAKWLQKAAPAT